MSSQTEAFEASRTRLVGISKDLPQETLDWQAEADFEERVEFPLLSDTECTAARAFGVYDLDHDMALPAIVLVNGQTREVAWTYVGESIADRPELDLVLEQAQALHAKQGTVD